MLALAGLIHFLLFLKKDGEVLAMGEGTFCSKYS